MTHTDTRQIFSLTDLIRGLIEYATSAGVKSFPPFNDRMWHGLLYKLKKVSKPSDLIAELIENFDWNGPYPKYPALNQIIFSLRYICQEKSLTNQRICLIHRSSYKSFECTEAKNAIIKAYGVSDKIPGFFER
jgi:hypothetical protein